MKILLVVPLFPPDKGVSTLRAKFFFDEMSKKYEVDILKFGEKTNLDGHVKTIDKRLFAKLTTTIMNSKKIKNLLSDTIKQYDCCIVSAPPYNIYEIGKIATDLNIPVIYDYRDQPDMIYFEKIKQNQLIKPIRWSRLKLTETYIYSKFKKAYAIMCAGNTSTSLLQNKFKNLNNIYNVGNGFNLSDMALITSFNNKKNKIEFFIGCGGNLYDFRDTNSLRVLLAKIDLLSGNKEVSLLHWGKLSESLEEYIKTLKNIIYVQKEPLDREKYLIELSKVDIFLLACSDNLIWEPTTTVYDYIMYDKPILYSGLKNNEAWNTLESANKIILTHETLNSIDLDDDNNKQEKHNNSCPEKYSREYQYKSLANILSYMEYQNDIK